MTFLVVLTAVAVTYLALRLALRRYFPPDHRKPSWTPARMLAAVLAAACALELVIAAFFTPAPPDPSILKGIRPWGGHSYFAWMVLIPGAALHLPDDGARSSIIVYEDGKPLGPWRSNYEEVSGQGLGRYLIGGQNGTAFVILSTSDNSNPATNGRTYTVCDPEAPAHVEAIIGIKSGFAPCRSRQ
jgi:hypothetical protein